MDGILATRAEHVAHVSIARSWVDNVVFVNVIKTLGKSVETKLRELRKQNTLPGSTDNQRGNLVLPFRLLRRLLLPVLLAFAAFIIQLPCSALGRQVPLSLDVIDPDRSLDSVLKPYVVGLRKRIEKRWIPNVLSPKRSAKVYIMILQDGTISRVEITASSGDGTFDESVVRAVHDSNPLPQIPMEVLNIEATFDNRYMSHENVQANLQRMQLRMARGGPAPNLYQQYQQPIRQAFTRNMPDPQPAYQQSNMFRGEQEGDWSSEARGRDAGVPEVSPEPINTSSRFRSESNERNDESYATSDRQFDHPLNSAQFRQLSDEEKREYKSWLRDVWLKAPMSEELRVKTIPRKASPRK